MRLAKFAAKKLSQVLCNCSLIVNLFGTELPFFTGDNLRCAAQVCNSGSVHCAPGGRGETHVGFVAQKYPKYWVTGKLTYLVISFLFHAIESLCCPTQVCDSCSVQCSLVAEVRHLLDL